MQLELKQLQEQAGITFVYVTPDQEKALTMSDCIAVIVRTQNRSAHVTDSLQKGDAVRVR